MASDALAVPLPKARRKRKRPWSPETKATLCSFVVDVSLAAAILLDYLDPKLDPFGRFFDLSISMVLALSARHTWRKFQTLRKRDERDD